MPGVPSSRACEACRKQKKKCDELKPNCSRCARLRISCVGNGIQRYKFQELTVHCPSDKQKRHDTGRSVIAASLIDSSQVGLTQKERFYLNFFRQNTSKQVASYFSRTFWDQIVHLIGEAQPAVRHAAIGVGALHWNHEVLVLDNLNKSLPVQQCSKALGHVQQILRVNLPNCTQIETVLSTCLVLGALSMIQGDARAASWHLTSGWRLMDQWQQVGLNNSTFGASLMQAFTQNKLRWFSLAEGDNYPDLTLPDVIAGRFPVIDTLESAEETSGFVVAIGWLALQVKSQPSAEAAVNRVGVAVTLLGKLRGWKDRIAESMKVHELLPRAEKMMLFLDIWIHVLYIRVSTDVKLADGETRYDESLTLFRQTIQRAENLLLHKGPETWMGIVTPLVFCALKCRDWHLRHDALRLLSFGPYTQGKWSIANTALVIAQVIHIESVGFTPHDIIPESSRIHSLCVEFLPGEPMIRICYRRPHFNKHTRTDTERNGWESVSISY